MFGKTRAAKLRPVRSHDSSGRGPSGFGSVAGAVSRAAVLVAAALTVAGVAADDTRQPDPAKAHTPLAEIRGVPTPLARPVRALGEQPEVQELYEAARALVDEGQYRGAVDRLDGALDLADGDYYELPYLMAVAKYRLGDYGEARTFAELAAALRHGAADVHYLLGRLYHQQKQLERAVAHYRTATLAAGREPNNPRVTAAWFWLGESLAERGYWAAAYECYTQFDEAIWETHPEHRHEDEVVGLLAERRFGLLDVRLDLLERLERWPEAVRIADEALARWPGESRLERLYAQALLGAGQAAEALTFCRARLAETVSTADDEETPAWSSSPLVSVAVVAASAAGQLDEWLAELIQQVSEGERTEMAVAVARRLAAMEQYAPAARLWQALAQQRPDDADAAWALATMQRAAGDLEPALDTLIRLVRANPEAAEVPHARLAAWMESFAATEDDLELLARLSGQEQCDFAARFVLGLTAAALKQYETAEELFRAALEARPDFTLARVGWGQMLLSQYRWEEAKSQAQAALEHAPRSAAAHFVLAVAHAGLDESEQAEEAYRSALRYRPDDVSYALALAQHYRRSGDLLAAQRYFQQALAVEPTNGEAVENLIDSYLGGGKTAIARAQLRAAEARDLPDDVLRRVCTTVRFADAPFQAEHLAELKRQFEEHPTDLETGLKLAAGLYVRRRSAEAVPVAERLRALRSTDERVAALTARLYARRLEFGQAATLLEELARRYPNRAEVLVSLADAYLADFRLADARRILRRLLELEPSDPARRAYRGRLLLSYAEFSEFDGALELLTAWAEEEGPEQDGWLREKLRVLVLAGRDQEAIDLATERLAAVAAKSEQEEDELFMRREELVQVAMDTRRFKYVVEHLQQWLEAEPQDGQLTQWLVQALIADERADEALEALDRFRPTTPLAEAAVREWRARAYQAAGRVEQAAQELQVLLEEEPSPLAALERADVWTRLIEVYAKGERYDDALAQCDRWLKEYDRGDQRSAILWLRCRTSVLAQAGRQDEYLEVAEHLLELDPENTGLNNDLGYTWVDAGQNLERATGMIRKAVADEPLQPAYLDSLGWAYYKAGDFSGAREYLRRATRLREGQDPVIYDHCGDAEYRLGAHEAARQCWETALELVEQKEEEGGLLRPAELLASVRAKLTGLAQGESPKVAPTAAEQ